MDKQKLMDRIVEDFNGVWPNGWVTAVYDNELDCFSSWPPRRNAETLEYVCTPEEFEQHAKDKGFINGFLWGKEYPTNCKKPGLPDDCEYQVKFNGMPKFDSVHRTNKTWKTIWESVQSFKIVGDCYKPKQPESHSKPSADNSWHEKGELPPVGTECEYNSAGDKWHQVEITAHAKLGLCFIEKGCAGENYTSRDASKFRPIKSEREHLIGVISSAGNLSDGMLADAIIAAGWSRDSQESSS